MAALAPLFLNPIQRKMLGGPFFIDGRHNRNCLPDATTLVEMGFLTMREGGDSQWTTYNYEPTEAGKAALLR